jgi:hypothetical protein
MKTTIYYPIVAVAAVMLFIFSSCTKDAVKSTTTATKTTTTSVTTSTSIAVAVTSLNSTSKDTIFMVNCFPPHSKKDSVAFSSLPSAIGTYLTANYLGYTFKTAFKIIDSVGTTTDYIVIIQYNGVPVGLKFTAAGVFEKVLEQQDSNHMNGQPWQPGAPFGDRNGPLKDTLALSAIPSAVLTSFESAYPDDTLLHASVTPDTTYILISADKGLYATNISASGKVINRMEIQPPGPAPMPIPQDKLPAAILTYLTSTYPGYVFNGAFVLNSKGAIAGYDVLITENSTNYDVRFDGSGNFVTAITLH